MNSCSRTHATTDKHPSPHIHISEYKLGTIPSSYLAEEIHLPAYLFSVYSLYFKLTCEITRRTRACMHVLTKSFLLLLLSFHIIINYDYEIFPLIPFPTTLTTIIAQYNDSTNNPSVLPPFFSLSLLHLLSLSLAFF